MSNNLRSSLIRLAHANPELRHHLLPLLTKTAGVSWLEVERGDLTEDTRDKIWHMYKTSYAKLGLIVSSLGEMLSEYDHWRLACDGDRPIAFSVAKSTPFGIKSGLAGSDGSAEGKAAIKQLLSTIYKRPGYYSEVSHAVEHIALKAGAPVICATYAPMILKKPVEPSEDGLHYTRTLKGVGKVEKILVGNPRGVAVTDYNDPHCPIQDLGSRLARDGDEDTLADVDAHLACLLGY